MSSSFEQQLKERLEQSSPEDLGYRPDREQLWNRIATQQKSRKIPLRLWVSHAAAIAAGLLIGVFFLATYKDRAGDSGLKPSPAPQVTAVTPQQAAAPPATTGNTPGAPTAATQPAAVPPQQNLPVQHPQVTAQPQITAAATKTPATRADVPPAQDLPDVQEKEQAPVVAQAERRKPKVLHLMDIDNENTRVMRSPQQQNMSWAWLVPPNQATSAGTSFSAQLKQDILKFKN